jgi:hypothetical protein
VCKQAKGQGGRAALKGGLRRAARRRGGACLSQHAEWHYGGVEGAA